MYLGKRKRDDDHSIAGKKRVESFGAAQQVVTVSATYSILNEPASIFHSNNKANLC